MVSEAIKLKKLENTAELQRELLRIITSPVFAAVIGFALVETLQAIRVQDQPLMGTIAGTALEGGIVSIAAAQALGPVLPDLLKAGGEAGGAIMKLLPLLAAA